MSTVFLDGQQNLAALTVPGVYGDIILPTPFLLGLPTNIEGLVGVGQWGPLNALIPVSKQLDCATALGVPKIRNHDIASYVAAATQVGGAIGFMCVRVSDGTDTAASGVLPSSAWGTFTFTQNPANNATISINGQMITFVTGVPAANQVAIASGNLTQTLVNLLAFLNASTNALLTSQNYYLNTTTSVLQVTAVAGGAGGNSTVIASTVTGCTVSGSTLAGGGSTGLTAVTKYSGTLGNSVTISIQNGTQAGSFLASIAFPGLVPEQFNNIAGTGQTFWSNLVTAINNGTPYRGPSQVIVASLGAGTGQPTVSSPITLTGGTDGDAGVTDATLIGQDIVPRKGMYVLRNANCDGFTLCDLQTTADYAIIASFGLSETCLPVFATTSGDTIADALSIRINSGIDTPWFWLILGDYPTFYDSINGVSRLINSSAFGLGIIGNLSPQQSPLNKPLQGISATQRSTAGQTYSDVELSLINQGGIDTILAPPSTPGGYYFSFAAARNASSNTAANGIEYTRMTNFLIRTTQSKAAGSFVGRLQSIQPNDQTRAQAKAMFDGLSAQLASPQVGLGINGQGMIDIPWIVVCDLTNNPPYLQALGYMFLYWTVRYLNVVRYFVVKFQGGGNVQVNVQTAPPTPSQFATLSNTIGSLAQV